MDIDNIYISTWINHIKKCKQCKFAISFRFLECKDSKRVIFANCCDIGKVLYKVFLIECEKNE